MTAPPPALERRLGALDGAVIVISNVIGVGIFTTPGVVATMLPDTVSMLAVWAIGGALALAGAFAYAELAARRPQAGGEYVYLRESFGPLAAFLTGWTSFVAGFSGAIAAGAVGLAAYLDRLIPGAGNAAPLMSWQAGPLTMAVSMRALVAIAVIVALTLVHARGLGPGRVVQNTVTIAKVLALVAFVTAGLVFVPAQPGATAAAPAASTSTWLLALVPVMFSYAGWNAAVYLAEEIRDPGRNLPRALGIGTVIVVALFLALNAVYLRVVPRDMLSGSIGVGELAAGRLFGATASALFAAVAIAVILGSVSAMTLAGPRVYYAMARDGLFFSAAARVHPRYRTPATAIVAQGAWSVLLVLSGTFEQLLTYTGFAVILFSALAVLSLFAVRRRGDSGTFRTWGYPWAPALFCAVSGAIVVNTLFSAPRVAGAGLCVMAAGIPLYWWMARRHGATS